MLLSACSLHYIPKNIFSHSALQSEEVDMLEAELAELYRAYLRK